MTGNTLEQRARELLAAEYRRLGERHNVPELIADAETIEAGEEWDFWMDAAHAAVEAALRLSAGTGVDWRAQYRLQTAMRYMDNAPRLTLSDAYKMADHDVRGLELAAAPRHEPGEG